MGFSANVIAPLSLSRTIAGCFTGLDLNNIALLILFPFYYTRRQQPHHEQKLSTRPRTPVLRVLSESQIFLSNRSRCESHEGDSQFPSPMEMLDYHDEHIANTFLPFDGEKRLRTALAMSRPGGVRYPHEPSALYMVRLHGFNGSCRSLVSKTQRQLLGY